VGKSVVGESVGGGRCPEEGRKEGKKKGEKKGKGEKWTQGAIEPEPLIFRQWCTYIVQKRPQGKKKGKRKKGKKEKDLPARGPCLPLLNRTGDARGEHGEEKHRKRGEKKRPPRQLRRSLARPLCRGGSGYFRTEPGKKRGEKNGHWKKKRKKGGREMGALNVCGYYTTALTPSRRSSCHGRHSRHRSEGEKKKGLWKKKKKEKHRKVLFGDWSGLKAILDVIPTNLIQGRDRRVLRGKKKEKKPLLGKRGEKNRKGPGLS